jgi:predicted SprT family Zn-dependent metalloprotease
MLAESFSELEKYRGIGFNRIWVQNYDILQNKIISDVNYAFSPIGTACLESLVTHEFGHQIEYFLFCHNLYDFIKDLWNEYYDSTTRRATIRSCRNIKKQLSEYACNCEDDLFAEGFKEYIHSPNPRPLAKRIGNGLENALATYRAKKR